MNNNTKTLLLVAIGIAIGGVAGSDFGRFQVRKSAIEAGAGRWHCDEHGAREWRWTNSKTASAAAEPDAVFAVRPTDAGPATEGE